MARTKFEYAARKKRFKGYVLDDAQVVAWLNRLGAAGWEVVKLGTSGSFGGGLVCRAVLKRALLPR